MDSDGISLTEPCRSLDLGGYYYVLVFLRVGLQKNLDHFFGRSLLSGSL